MGELFFFYFVLVLICRTEVVPGRGAKEDSGYLARWRAIGVDGAGLDVVLEEGGTWEEGIQKLRDTHTHSLSLSLLLRQVVST